MIIMCSYFEQFREVQRSSAWSDHKRHEDKRGGVSLHTQHSTPGNGPVCSSRTLLHFVGVWVACICIFLLVLHTAADVQRQRVLTLESGCSEKNNQMTQAKKNPKTTTTKYA